MFKNILLSIPKPLYYYSAGITAVGGAYLLKDHLTGPMYENTEDITNKVVIVTGSNSGIGKETVRELAKRKAKVIMACRDMQKCETAREEIVLETKNKFVYCRQCDLASQESIRKFVDVFKKEHSTLDILINNAGIMRCDKDVTKDGIEMQLGVNYMGHFLLTNLLLDVLKKSAPSRIVNISSIGYKHGTIQMDDINSEKDYNSENAYFQSKLALILFTRELANRLKGTGVTVNAVHPGIVNTNIMRHMPYAQHFVTRMFANCSMWVFVKPPRKGAQPILFAALDPSLKDVTGVFFNTYNITDVSEEAKDNNVAKWLWAVSEKWTKLNYS